MIKKLCPYLCSLLSVLTLAVGCGKKVAENKTKPDREINPQKPDLEIELDKQDLFCGSDRACPDYITKIAFVNKSKLEFCTGFLIEDDVVATASSCLPETLRIPDADCAKDAHFFFAERGQKPTREACDKVLLATPIKGEFPFLWRSDVAYLKLKNRLKRRTLSFPNDRMGMNDQSKFYSWVVDQIDEHQGIVRKMEDCQSVHNSYLNPLSNQPNSPVMTMTGCQMAEGNSGAPILDFRDRIRGFVSRAVDTVDVQNVEMMRILERPLKPIFYASNGACVPYYGESEVNTTECNKRLEIGLHNDAKKELLKESKLFDTAIKNLESQANRSTIYTNFQVKLESDGEFYHMNVEPKCFKNVSNWINTFPGNPKFFRFHIVFPQSRIKKSMNENGIIAVRDINDGNVETHFEFNPRVLRTVPQGGGPRRANLYVWTSGPSTTYENLAECQP